MAGFERHEGVLACDGVPLAEIAASTGTPVHVYSGALIEERWRAFDAALAGSAHRVHYALKANATVAVVRRLRSLGARADVNSGGELEVALRAGFAPHDIVFTGVGKTRAELERAVRLGVRSINAESRGELDRIERLAAAAGTVARVAVRINPDIEAGSHPHISTGHRATKFGVSAEDAVGMVREAATRPSLHVVGLHVHVGSQITTIEPLARAAELLVRLSADLAADGIALEHLDLGGGLGISYRAEQAVIALSDYAEMIHAAARAFGGEVIVEPGRWIVGPAGVLLTEVVDIKQRPDGGWFVITDAGMTDLLRPALYGAWHEIESVAPREGHAIHADIAGPVCETSDTFGRDRPLPAVEVGDLLVVRDTGAYGAVMASNYNRRPIAAEVLVDAGRATTIRRRQNVDDMLQWDV
jgi:diaminopimelate decarboxylase